LLVEEPLVDTLMFMVQARRHAVPWRLAFNARAAAPGQTAARTLGSRAARRSARPGPPSAKQRPFGRDFTDRVADEFDVRLRQPCAIPVVVDQHALGERRIIGDDALAQALFVRAELAFDVVDERVSQARVVGVDRARQLGPAAIEVQRRVQTSGVRVKQPKAIPARIVRHVLDQPLLRGALGKAWHELHGAAADDRDALAADGGSVIVARAVERRRAKRADAGQRRDARPIQLPDRADDEVAGQLLQLPARRAP
jgi:hypothetical protein